jgi:nicotinamidase/pyrazinamidase
MKALIVVDAQYDFMPGGALAVNEGDQIVPVINQLLPKFDLVIFTKDWHPTDMDAFASQHPGKRPFAKYETKDGNEDTLWPPHCMQNTRGADLHDDIDFGSISGDFYIFKKGMERNKHPYSGFGAEGLDEFLKERDVDEVHIVGLATDFCVKDTAVDAAKLGYKTSVVMDGTRPIDPDLGPVLREFMEEGVTITQSWAQD